MEQTPRNDEQGDDVGPRGWDGSPGRVADDATRRLDPEVPERARRRRFTAKYKLKVLAVYDAAPDGEKGCCAVRACIPATSPRGAMPATLARWPGWRSDAGASVVMRPPSRSPSCKPKIRGWSGSWRPRPAPWWTFRQTARARGDVLRERGHRAGVDTMTDQAITALAQQLGVGAACEAVGAAAQASYHRRHRRRRHLLRPKRVGSASSAPSWPNNTTNGPNPGATSAWTS